jgi:hypothetical protein
MDRKHKKAAQLAANGVPQEEIESVVYGGTSYILPAGGYQQEEVKQEDEGEVTGGMAIPVDKTASTNGGKMSYSQSLKSPNNAKSASGANKADASLDSHMADSAARAVEDRPRLIEPARSRSSRSVRRLNDKTPRAR